MICGIAVRRREKEERDVWRRTGEGRPRGRWLLDLRERRVRCGGGRGRADLAVSGGLISTRKKGCELLPYEHGR